MACVRRGLRYRGSYQGSEGQNMDGPTAQQTVSRCLQEVSTALNAPNILRKYIKFPQDRNERNLIKRKFYDKYGLPGVIGCIDCTHIAIIRPSQHDILIENIFTPSTLKLFVNILLTIELITIA